MALNTTDTAGQKDFAIPPEVRLYFFAGTHHGGGDQLKQPPLVQPKPPLDLPTAGQPQLVLSAAARAAGRVARLDRERQGAAGERLSDHRAQDPGAAGGRQYPYVPASKFSNQGVTAQRKHLDRGPAFSEVDIAGVMAEPPKAGAAYPVLVPQVDADGNHTDGLRNSSVAGSAWHLRWMERPQGRLQRRRFLRPDRRLSFLSSAPRPSASRPRTRGRRCRSAIRPTTPTWRRWMRRQRNSSPNASCCRRTRS